jgi:hypothetical protein
LCRRSGSVFCFDDTGLMATFTFFSGVFTCSVFLAEARRFVMA